MKKTIFTRYCDRCKEYYKTQHKYSYTCVKCNKRNTVMKRIEVQE